MPPTPVSFLMLPHRAPDRAWRPSRSARREPRETPPQDQARLPSRWTWPHLRGFDAVSGCGIAFPNAILAAWTGCGEAPPCTGTSYRVGQPSGRLSSAFPRRRVSSDHARAAVIHLCRSSPSASAASFIAATASRSESYEDSMDPNIAADRKRSRTSGTVAIRGRHHTRAPV